MAIASFFDYVYYIYSKALTILLAIVYEISTILSYFITVSFTVDPLIVTSYVLFISTDKDALLFI